MFYCLFLNTRFFSVNNHILFHKRLLSQLGIIYFSTNKHPCTDRVFGVFLTVPPRKPIIIPKILFSRKVRTFIMEITYQTFLIVCPFLFLAGLIDAIGGGGGLISLPAYLIAGLPPHMAIATNKLSSTCGTTLATFRFIRNGLVNLKLVIPAVAAAIIGASIGANISLTVDDSIMLYMMVAILPICAFLVLNKKLFHDGGSDEIHLNKKLYCVTSLSALIIGMYDGFYGPGTGTFLIIAFTVL